jgi:predicted Fe-Mo cluster-binding NifX family protein
MLIIRGKPTNEMLEETKFKLITEFSELSNQTEAKSMLNSASKLYRYEIQIRGYEVAYGLIVNGIYPKAIEYLNLNGIKCKTPENENERETILKSLKIKLKNKIAKYKEAKTVYDLNPSKEEKPTRKYFNRLLVMLSVCEVVKIQLDPKKMTVSEFAEYLNIYSEYQNQLISMKYGRKH